jgi:hypothetical protein
MGDRSMAPYIAGSAVEADQAAGILNQVDEVGVSALPCMGGPGADGGTVQTDAAQATDATGDASINPVDAAGVEDADSLPDAAVAQDVTAPLSDAAPDAAVSSDASSQPKALKTGCGCNSAAHTAQTDGVLEALALIALAAISRSGDLRPRARVNARRLTDPKLSPFREQRLK